MGRSSTDTLRIDPEFRDLLGELSTEEREQLRANIVADGGAIDPIIVWREQWVIVDGHNRYEICTDTGLPYKVRDKSFASRADVIAWMIEHQGGRRNMTPERIRYLRGKAYEAAKKDDKELLVPGASHQENSKNTTNPSVGKNYPPKKRTSKSVASKVGVSEKTVRNDAKFSKAVDKLDGAAKKAVLDKEVKATTKDVQRLAELPAERQTEVVKSVKEGQYKSVGAALSNGKSTNTEPKAESSSDPGPVDGWGVPIQPHAAAAFDPKLLALHDEMLACLKRADKIWSQLADTPSGAYMLRPGVSINGRTRYKNPAIQTAIMAAQDVRPTYTVCPRAYHAAAFPESNHKHDETCVLCHGLGWSRALGKDEVDPKVVATIKEAFGV